MYIQLHRLQPLSPIDNTAYRMHVSVVVHSCIPHSSHAGGCGCCVYMWALMALRIVSCLSAFLVSHAAYQLPLLFLPSSLMFGNTVAPDESAEPSQLSA